MDMKSDSQLDNSKWAADQIGSVRYLLLLVAVLGQLATVIITWQVWQVRVEPSSLPNLPVFDWPQVPFAIPVVVSLAYMVVDPKRGFWVHVVVLVVASLFDQFRMQPQFLALVMLMWACISFQGTQICRWFLASLWFWAGLHKIISPHWFAHASYWLVNDLGLVTPESEELHFWFALAVAVGEVLIGLAAIFKLRLAAILCVAMHVTIFTMLVYVEWNYSVLPWNLATMIVGPWIMWTIMDAKRPLSESNSEKQTDRNVDNGKPLPRTIEWAIVATCFIAPAGFYFGLLDHGYASVLYSDFVPRALITGQDSLQEIRGWDPIHVPFPYERRTHRQFFERVAADGDKLHIRDPRPSLPDLYFRLVDGKAVEIELEDFYSDDSGLAGIGNDDRWAFFQLNRLGQLKMRRYSDKKDESESEDNKVWCAFIADPDLYDPRIFELLQGLPNLTQIQLAGCPVQDKHLSSIGELRQLEGIGLNNTSVTDDCLQYMEELQALRILEIEQTQISIQGLKRLQQKLGLGTSN